MKMIKWVAVFILAFLCAWVLIFTFTQAPFKQTASARILYMWTPAIPIYLYVAGSFAIGFFAGCAIAVYNYITLQTKVHHKIKECTSLQEQVAELTQRLELSKPIESATSFKSSEQPEEMEPLEYSALPTPQSDELPDMVEHQEAQESEDAREQSDGGKP